MINQRLLENRVPARRESGFKRDALRRSLRSLRALRFKTCFSGAGRLFRMDQLKRNQPLAERTTLEIGGCAEHFVEATAVDELRDALLWAREQQLPVTILGGGSNVVVADEGVPGLTIALGNRGIDLKTDGDEVLMTVAAGEEWDDVVAAAVAENLAGIECLSGIPGTAGATPVQNVGAYGQEVASVIREVRVFNLESLEEQVLSRGDCAFGYRSSVFRNAGNSWIVVGVVFELRPGGPPTLNYAQLAERFPGASPPSLGEARAAVLDLRREKSMVWDEADPNHRSAGSFFVNPVVDDDGVESVTAAARSLGVLGLADFPPVYEVGEGRYKLSAGWLVEHAGFPRGAIHGRVGLSSNHALALINRGGATAAELIDFAVEIRRGVRSHLGIDLTPEPVFLGFPTADPTV